MLSAHVPLSIFFNSSSNQSTLLKSVFLISIATLVSFVESPDLKLTKELYDGCLDLSKCLEGYAKSLDKNNKEWEARHQQTNPCREVIYVLVFRCNH